MKGCNELFCQLFQQNFSPAGDNQVVAMLGEFHGNRPSKTSRSTRYKYCFNHMFEIVK